MSSRGKGIRIQKQKSRKPTRTRREVVAPLPETVLHRRIYFLNTDRTRFISIGYYPDRNYEPHVEIGGVKCGVILTPYYFTTLVNHQPKLTENLCNKQQFKCDEETFCLRLLDNKRVTIQCDGLRICLTINDISFLLCNSTKLLYYVARYVFATSYVKTYAAKCSGSSEFVPPRDEVSQYILYDVICDELNPSLVSLPK
jgi:hypothetical protein